MFIRKTRLEYLNELYAPKAGWYLVVSRHVSDYCGHTTITGFIVLGWSGFRKFWLH